MSETNGEGDEAVSATAFAKEVGLNWETVTRAIRRREIPAERTAGGHYLIRRDDVPPGWVESAKAYSRARWSSVRRGQRAVARDREIAFLNREVATLRRRVEELTAANKLLLQIVEGAKPKR